MPRGYAGNAEGSDQTIPGVKISCGQYPFMNVLIEDCCDYIGNQGIKTFPNQLFD